MNSTRYLMAVFSIVSVQTASLATPAKAQKMELSAGTSDVFSYICANKQVDPTTKAIRFGRGIEMPGKGYEWDNPGARICFRTDAREITVKLLYSEMHASKSARNGKGLFYIDGQTRPEWLFDSSATSIVRDKEEVSVPLPVPAEAGFHDYAIVLPYGDSVELLGLTVNEGAHFEPFSRLPNIRYVAYGDSITQGFTASHIGLTYPFLLAENKHWQIFNMGFGGRSANANDGKVVAPLKADIMTILIGVNDWQGGVPLEKFQAQMEGLLHNIRKDSPTTPIYLITPLWVNPSWKPKTEVADLDSYRQVIRNIAQKLDDPHLHLIEGPSLIDHDAKYFDKVAVHPNDAGFEMMAGRLAMEIHFPN